MKKIGILLSIILLFTSCISTKSTLKNVDNNAPVPRLTRNNTFVITAFSTDKKYGYDKDYPVNIYYNGTKDDVINQQRFLNALAGPKGEPITFTKLESCCPFPSINTEMGAGFLDIYEIRWAGQKKPVVLYLNIYEKGYLFVPMGLSLKQ